MRLPRILKELRLSRLNTTGYSKLPVAATKRKFERHVTRQRVYLHDRPERAFDQRNKVVAERGKQWKSSAARGGSGRPNARSGAGRARRPRAPSVPCTAPSLAVPFLVSSRVSRRVQTRHDSYFRFAPRGVDRRLIQRACHRSSDFDSFD